MASSLRLAHPGASPFRACRALLLAAVAGAAQAADPLTGTAADAVPASWSSGVVIVPIAPRETVLDLDYEQHRARVRRLQQDGTFEPIFDDSPVGTNPVAVALARRSPHAVIANSGSDDLSVLELGPDGNPREVARPPSGGQRPSDVAAGFDDFFAVPNRDSDLLTLFRLDRRGNLRLVAGAPTGIGPHVVAISPRGLIAVGNSASNDLSLFTLGRDGNLHTVDRSFPIGASPRAVAFGPDGESLFVAARNPGQEDRILGYEVAHAGTRPHRDLAPESVSLIGRSSHPAGQFLTSLVPTADRLFAATVNLAGQDEIREYLRDGTSLALDATVATPGQPPSFKKVAILEDAGLPGPIAIVSEFQGGRLRSIVYHPK